MRDYNKKVMPDSKVEHHHNTGPGANEVYLAGVAAFAACCSFFF